MLPTRISSLSPFLTSTIECCSRRTSRVQTSTRNESPGATSPSSHGTHRLPPVPEMLIAFGYWSHRFTKSTWVVLHSSSLILWVPNHFYPTSTSWKRELTSLN